MNKALKGGKQSPRKKKPARGGVPKATKGTAANVACPICGGSLDFRDMLPDSPGGSIDGLPGGHGGVIDQGDSVHCDHCDGKLDIASISQVTVLHLRPAKSD